MAARIELKWLMFSSWKEIIENDEGKYEFPCVYVVADSNNVPLYIGATTQKQREKDGKLWAGGIRARYYHDWTVLDACMEGTGKSVYITEVPKDVAFKIEKQLIYENKPKYNTNQKTEPPKKQFELHHRGKFPNFRS